MRSPDAVMTPFATLPPTLTPTYTPTPTPTFTPTPTPTNTYTPTPTNTFTPSQQARRRLPTHRRSRRRSLRRRPRPTRIRPRRRRRSRRRRPYLHANGDEYLHAYADVHRDADADQHQYAHADEYLHADVHLHAHSDNTYTPTPTPTNTYTPSPTATITPTPTPACTGPSLVHKYSAIVGDGTNGFSSITATFGTAPTAGNLLIAVFGESGSNNIATPSGWQVAIVYQNTSPGGAIFYKIASGSESTVTVTTSGGSSTSYGMGLQLYEYTGAAATSPLDDAASPASGTGTSLTSGSVTTTQACDLLISGAAINANATFTWASPFTEEFDFQNPGTNGVPSAARTAQRRLRPLLCLGDRQRVCCLEHGARRVQGGRSNADADHHTHADEHLHADADFHTYADEHVYADADHHAHADEYLHTDCRPTRQRRRSPIRRRRPTPTRHAYAQRPFPCV